VAGGSPQSRRGNDLRAPNPDYIHMTGVPASRRRCQPSPLWPEHGLVSCLRRRARNTANDPRPPLREPLIPRSHWRARPMANASSTSRQPSPTV
jgi:hypothetical protein